MKGSRCWVLCVGCCIVLVCEYCVILVIGSVVVCGVSCCVWYGYNDVAVLVLCYDWLCSWC